MEGSSLLPASGALKGKRPGPAEAFLEDYFERLRTDYVDVLFLHNCNTQEDYDRLMGPGGLLELAGRIRREGRARFIGLSGHNVVTSRQAVESGQIDVLMFPINLTSQAVPGYRDLLDACVAHRVGLVAMKSPPYCIAMGGLRPPPLYPPPVAADIAEAIAAAKAVCFLISSA